MRFNLSNKSSGDTIIEVILAVAVFSMVAVGAITVMNNGISVSQRSLETSLVRQQIDAQAEMLRFVHDRAKEDRTGSYGALWNSFPKTAAPTQLSNVSTCPDHLPESFALTASPASGIAKTNTTAFPATYARVDGSQSQGISIQLTRVSGGRAYDAYIQACWEAPGLNLPMTLGTIVRIYDKDA